MIRGILFDCFGVLHLDSNTAYFLQFPNQKAAISDLNKRADHGFIGKADYLQEAAALVGRPEDEILHEIATGSTLNTPLIRYIKSVLKPRYKIGMVSNMGHGWVQDFFDEHELHDLFDVVVLSSEEGIIKPNPLIFERAAVRLGLSPDECMMIDDRKENCNGAVVAGMQSICFSSNEDLIERLNIVISQGGRS